MLFILPCTSCCKCYIIIATFLISFHLYFLRIKIPIMYHHQFFNQQQDYVLLRLGFDFYKRKVCANQLRRNIIKSLTHLFTLTRLQEHLHPIATIYANVKYNEQQIIQTTRECIKLSGFCTSRFL